MRYILILAMIAFSFSASAQKYTDNYTRFIFHESVRFNKSLRIPRTLSSDVDTGTIAYYNGFLYLKDSTNSWNKQAMAASLIDSVKKKPGTDSVFYYKNGVAFLSFVDGSSGTVPTLQEVLATESRQALLFGSTDISIDFEGATLSFGDQVDLGNFRVKSDSIVFPLQGPQSSDTSAGKPLLMTPTGNIRPAATFWRNPIPISYLQNAHAATDINNGDYTQTWRWNNLSNGIGLNLLSNSTATTTTQKLFRAELTGANATGSQSSYAAEILNNHTGSGINYGLVAGATGGALNVGLSVSNGNVHLPTLANSTSQNRIVGQISSSNYLGYLNAGYGITIGSGNLSADTATLFPAVRATISGGGSPSLSSIGAATATNDINNADNGQIWRWNSLSSGRGIMLSALTTSSSGTGSGVLKVHRSGAHSNSSVTTYGLEVENSHNGTSSTNVAAYLSAVSGTTNYALITDGGNVGIGTATPDSLLTVQNGFWAKRGVRLSGITSSSNSVDSMMVINAVDGTVGMRSIPSGGGSSATVGTYSTRIGLSPSNGDEFFQTDIGRDAPDGKYYYLNSKWHYNPLNDESLSTFWNEFHTINSNNTISDDGMIFWSGNSGTISYTNTTRPGVARFATSITTNGYAGFYTGAINNPASWINLPNGTSYFKASININTLSTAGERYAFRIGLANGMLGDFTSGVYLEYDESASANWRIKSANFGTRTTTTSGTAVATGWQTVELLVNSAGTSVEFWVDGTSLGTITTNIPGAGNGLGPAMIVQKSAGTSSRYIDVDYVKSWQRLNTDRN